MSTPASTDEPKYPSGTSPAAIRAALLPEDVPRFDRDYRHALDVAREALSLTDLVETLESWRRIAWSTQADPAAHRRMVQAAEHTQRTGEPPAGTRPWNSLKSELGL
ncbi:DUF6247 family protein [Amycolatopsis sp. Hca4]|uniref:DUF6247 family protein n=1 Tax=unclassified Amycolatopsis TaxID=2618356 RepID=UPI00158F9EDE|nr:DUF6247 family protein [Amycolatopsis sp. Hca4]QKV77961.1 hypothetical protein HUT10_32380 [Amycolatopsis sp. Hca4]